jgi:hypothetical protein
MAKKFEDDTDVASDELAKHLLWVLEMDRVVNLAVRRAQEENRRLGIPNYYEINGRIVSDQPEPQLEPAPSADQS